MLVGRVRLREITFGLDARQLIKTFKSGHDGSGLMIIDSLAGLSNPAEENSSDFNILPQLSGTKKFSVPAWTFSWQETEVRNLSSGFSQIEFYKGGYLIVSIHCQKEQT